MKSTGIIRRVDELGRVVIPKEIRDNLDIIEKDAIGIYTDGNKIVLQKYQPNCCFCGNSNDLINFHEKLICNKCIKQIIKKYEKIEK